ncbi:MAG: alkaline phosphatase family protein [Nitrospirae bacterium]|nr:alkaline phosphatase family protein [Nitrospirota bacterium]
MDLIRPWVNDGKLPAFRHIMGYGVSGDLQSTFPPVTAPAWTSFMTGKNPGKTDFFDFISHPDGGYEIRYANASARKADSLWRILSDSGRKVGVINVPMTFPPEEVSGFFISGMDTPDENSDFVRPREMRAELERRFGKIRLDIRHLGHMRNDRIRDKVLKELEELEDYRKCISLYLLEQYNPDVFMVVFNATDQVQHHFLHYMDSRHPLFDSAGSKRYGDAVFRIYRKIDENLGEIMKALPEDAAIIIMSDHGAGPVSRRHFFLNNFLQEIGVLAYKTGDQTKDQRQSLAWSFLKKVESFLKSRLSSRQKMLLARLFPGIRNKFESYLSLSLIDWGKTRAYSVEMLATSANIWVNLQGKRPQGTVEEKDYEELITYIINKLLELRDPEGKQIVSKIYRKQEIYNGPFLCNAPDLVLDWWSGEGFLPRASLPHEQGNAISIKKDGVRGGQDWSGTHKINGIFMAGGYPFKKGFSLHDAKIIDVAPTVLYLSGVPVPEDMDGRILTECIDDAFLNAHPVSFSKERKQGDSPAGRLDSAEEEEKIRERLRGLGYIS